MTGIVCPMTASTTAHRGEGQVTGPTQYLGGAGSPTRLHDNMPIVHAPEPPPIATITIHSVFPICSGGLLPFGTTFGQSAFTPGISLMRSEGPLMLDASS